MSPVPNAILTFQGGIDNKDIVKSDCMGQGFEKRAAVVWPLALIVAWTIAWLLQLRLRDALAWGADADTVHWVAMKIALWVVPVIVILRRERIAVQGFVELVDPLRGAAIGLAAGLALLAFSFAMDAVLGGASFNIPVLDFALLNGVLVAPLVEEFAVRGFYLSALERMGLPFPQANVRAGLVFVALHVPGWYFQGRLRSPVSMIQTAVFLWLLALLLGWLKKTSGSLYAPMVVHILNNVYSSARG
jgi:membrane protease YdiL (CAAX protease family)